MAGKRFLNPYAKIILCLGGMIWIGYHLLPQLLAGQTTGDQFIPRALVFLAFLFLLVQSVRQIFTQNNTRNTGAG